MKDRVLELKDGETLAARRLTRADRGGLQAFGASLSPETTRRFIPHPYDDATIDRLLTRSEESHDLTLGLFAGKVMVGYGFLWRYDERVPLLGIGLHDRYQERGAGRGLMEILIEAARENGNEGIELTTLPDNERAFALYRALGFHHYGNTQNLDGHGRLVTERAMFYEILSGATPYDGPHAPP